MGEVAKTGEVDPHSQKNITVDLILLPLQPIYGNTIQGPSAQSELERLARNAQLKMNWENRCQRQIKIGNMCYPADRKTVSMLFVMLGTEGRRIVSSRNPHLKMDTLTTVKLWRKIEEAFIHPRIIILTDICF